MMVVNYENLAVTQYMIVYDRRKNTYM